MPYPNEHACRIRPPSDFEDGSLRRVNGARRHDGRQYDVIFGRLKGESSTAEQAFRYPKDGWSADQARSHCRDHGGSFEAASKSNHSTQTEENTMIGTVEEDVKNLTAMVKQTHENLNKSFEEFKTAQAQAVGEFAKKGDIDPLLEGMRAKIAESMIAMQEKMDNALVIINRPRLGTDSQSDKDAEFRDARKFFTQIQTKRGKLEAGRDIADADVSLDAFRAYKSAFNRLMRQANERKLTDAEFKALSVGSDPDGGYTVHPQLSNRIIERQFESSPMRQVVTVETISSNSLELLEDPNEFSAARTSEQVSTGNTGTPAIGRREIVAYIMEARPRASQSLLDDSGIDIEAWIARKVANKFGRVEANEFIVGDGVGKGRGITTYADGTAWGTVQRIKSGANGGITYAQLAAIATGLKEPYYANAQWLMHRTLIGSVLALTASTTPLWIPSIAVGQPSQLMGYPVRFAQDFATPATSSLSGAFGDFRAGYTWVDRLGVRIQPDPFTAKPFVEFYTTKRSGGDVVDFDAFKVINLDA